MDLVSKVNFSLITNVLVENWTPNGHLAGLREYKKYVRNTEQFRKFITDLTVAAKSGMNKVTYLIEVQRRVTVSDKDKRFFSESATFLGEKLSIILSTSDKLLYVPDIEPLLQQKFPQFSLPESKFADTNPIYLESFDGVNVKYWPLIQNSPNKYIVIDTNLNQLWPIATGQQSIELLNLLSDTTQNIR